MADPSGILGVIGVATQLIQMTIQFGLDWKDAPSDARAFFFELQSLRTVLQETHKNVTQNSDFINAFEGRHSTILSHLGDQSQGTAAKSMLSACETELEKMAKDLKKRAESHRASWEALKGAFTAKKTRESVENLHRQCQALNSMAAIDAIAIGASTHCKVVEMHDHQLGREKKEEQKRILEWLTPIDYASQQIDFIKQRQSGTGQWLLQSPEFQEWLQGDRKTLFCPGIPGAGKTILTATVVEHLVNQFHNDPKIGISYIYCNFQRTEEQKLDDLLASLLKQLAEPLSSLPKAIMELHERHKMKRTRPSTDELSKALQLVTTSYSRVFVLIDALDECQTSGGCRGRLIEEGLGLQARYSVGLFMTSRFISEITNKFNKSCWLEIRASKEDVVRYLEDHIRQSSSTIQEMQDEIKKTISDAVDGMFLLARIYLDLLQREVKPRKVRKALQGLQKQVTGSGEEQRLKVLSHAYDEAMERINKQEPSHRELANQVLSWITCARRPLTTTELSHALTVEPGDSELDEGDLTKVGDMVVVCAGLVTVDEESDIIRLVHYTTQEYFQKTQARWFPTAEQDISTICITCLSFSEFETGPCETDDNFEQRLQNNPLYDYAARNWGRHARQTAISPEEVDRFLMFLTSPTLIEASSQALLVAKRWSGHSNYSQEFPRGMTGVHVAAYFGVGEAVAELLKAGADVNAKANDGRTPLYRASGNGHDSVVQQLLAAGADVNAKDNDGRTPLHEASGNGHDSVVQQLLAAGADVNAKANYGGTPLHWASGNGHDSVVQQLLAAGADVNAKEANDGGTPLHGASGNGHDSVVQQLLAAGADVNAKADDGRTPLYRASWNGHDSVVQQLLAAGADVNAKEADDDRTPLHWASWNGHDSVVQQLLAAGADVNAKEADDDRTP
ncbi:hypothetical protein V8F06_007037, partial [Rhypophila decipiens]